MSEALTRREVEVLQISCDGKCAKQIGQALGISTRTVRAHLARLREKLGAATPEEMVFKAVQAGYLDVDRGNVILEWEDTGTGLRLVRVNKALA